MRTPPVDDGPQQILVEWNQERCGRRSPLSFSLFQLATRRLLVDLPPPNAPLSALKAILAERTGVPPSQMRLLHSGFQLRDDRQSLADYRLYDEDPSRGSESSASSRLGGFSTLLRGFSWAPPRSRPPKRLLMIGSPETQASVSDLPQSSSSNSTSTAPPPAQKSFKAPILDERGALERLQQIKALLDPLEPRVAALERDSTSLKPAEVAQSKGMLSETLLQVLLKFDSIDVQGEWAQARAERKAGVKEVQALLDRLDAVKAPARESASVGSTGR
jgi:hypothetical protein